MKRLSIFISFIILSQIAFSQSEEAQIKSTLFNYIEGTSYNKVETLEKAFHPTANLYLSHKEKEVWIVPIKEYASWYKKRKPGEFNGRIGNVLSIDYFNDIAVAKAEILMPSSDMRYVDMFLLKKIQGEWNIISKTASGQESNQSGNRILFIVSNAHHYGTSDLPTGNSFSELVNAYDTFKKAGYTVDFVSPDGGSVPLGYINTSEDLHKEYLYSTDFMYALKNTQKPSEVDAKLYKAVHYIGGGSAMFGVPEDDAIQQLVMEIYEEYNGIVSSVCHGTAGIVHLKTKDGNYLVDGKTISGYPDSFERKDAEYFKQFPFQIQETIEARGGHFKFSPRNNAHVEVSGRVITGQNYLSSKEVALKIIEQLKAEKVK